MNFDGRPLPAGQITFIPMPGTKGPTAGATIKDGTFKIDSKGGTFEGKFRVEITSSRPSQRMTMNAETGKAMNIPEQYIPLKYNTQSQLTAEVKKGEDNKFPFDLTSK